MKTALTIAGSDPSGGAGIQADLKTFAAHGVYGMSVLTSVTSQNTSGVFDVFDIPSALVYSQLQAVFTDIFPDSVKIGMVSNSEIIESIARSLSEYKATKIVLDTVMISTSGRPLLSGESLNTLTSRLFPIADIITPNLPEASVLCGFDIKNENDMLGAAKVIYEKFGTAILLKGGHLNDDCNDLYFDGREIWLTSEKISNPNTHGTGCTLSSAISANLALGFDIVTSVKKAKEYVFGAINDGLDLGSGNGPLNHMYKIKFD